MVNFKDPGLDRTFAALADPTRRGLLAQLQAAPGRSVSALARPFPMSLPAVMKHLDVLADAGLITRRKAGRTVSVHLNATPMQQAMDWLAPYERFWSQSLDRLAALVEEDASCPPPTSSCGPAVPSAAASPPRRKGSSKPGPTR